MPPKTFSPWFIILFALLTGCGPMVPLSYQPEQREATLVQAINPDATITLEYIERQNGYHIFDLEVANHSSATVAFAPQHIRFYSSSHLFPIATPGVDVRAVSAANSALMMKYVFADSPWRVTSMYQQKMKQKEGAGLFFALLATGLVIYDGAQDSKESRQETWTKKDQQKADRRELLTGVAIIASQVAKAQVLQAQEDNYYVPYELFPECQIKPGESVRGKVFIRVETTYRFSRLIVPFLNTDYVLDLKRRGATVKSKR